jgi:hypothetical protein
MVSEGFLMPGSILTVFLIIAVQEIENPPPNIPFGGPDYKQYYASSKLILSGMNPYDHEAVWKIQKPLGAVEVQVPYGPPTSLLPFILLGYLDFPTAIQVQLILNVCLLVLSGFFWGQLLFPAWRWSPLLAAFCVIAWLPDVLLCGIGQVTAWTLFGFSGWLLCWQQQKPGWAGFFLALCIIKPHLAIIPVLYAGVLGLRQPRVLLVFVLTILGMVAVTLCIRPTFWSEYFVSLPASNPAQWFNSTLDGWGRLHLGNWFRVITVGVGSLFIGWTVLLSRREAATPANALLVLVISLCATPYAFSYDFVLLLPAFLLAMGQVFQRTNPFWIVIVFGWLLMDGFYLVAKAHRVHESAFFVIPWGGLALTLWLMIQPSDVLKGAKP